MLAAVGTAVGLATAVPCQAMATGSPTRSAVTSESVERIADLVRLWTFVRFFHVDERAMMPNWDRALAEAVAPTIAAPDDRAFGNIVQRMMARIQPDIFGAGPNSATGPAAFGDTPLVRLVNHRTVVSCAGVAENTKAAPAFGKDPALVASIRRYGIILDCRHFPEAERSDLGTAFGTWLSSSAAGLIAGHVERGARRERFFDGYPADRGEETAFVRGLADVRIDPFEASFANISARTVKMVFLVDSTTPDVWALAGGLQTSGAARLVAEGAMTNPGLYPFVTRHLEASVKVAEYIAPDGDLGFRPDSCVPAGADVQAMGNALTLLAGGKARGCAASATFPSLPPFGGPFALPLSGNPAVPLPLGDRIVALARLWGTFEYFQPYKSLADRPWSVALEEFIPVFAAASTREDYEDAVLRLSARADDGHVRVSGMRAHWLAAPFSPPIYVRPVEGGYAVAGLHDQSLAGKVRIGDEIVAVDGKSTEDITTRLRPYLSASTPQLLAQRIAGLLAAGTAKSNVRLTVARGSKQLNVVLTRTLPSSAAAQKPEIPQPSFFKIETDIGYVDLAKLTVSEADEAIDALMNTRAIIFDLRGYPKGTAWILAPRLALDGQQGAIAAQFRRPLYHGPSESEENWTSFAQALPTGDKPRYRGRIVVMIDDRAVSQSEHSALFFETATKTIFVGTPTSGTDGDVTYLALPGGLEVRFSGEDVRHADGRRLQRVGIQPDMTIAPTFKGLSSGKDEVLDAAVKQARAVSQ